MVRHLDIEGWKRRDHFHFYRDYELPFFSLCTDVEVTALVELARHEKLSFFLATLYLSLRAANEIEEFRYRIRGRTVVEHEVVHAGSTVLREDETFGFCYFDHEPDFARFAPGAAGRLERFHREGRGLEPQEGRDDLIYYSVLPWVSFTSFTHARRLGGQDTVPRIVFGRYRDEGGRLRMPVSVELHHALADGLHAARFCEAFQRGLHECRQRLAPAAS